MGILWWHHLYVVGLSVQEQHCFWNERNTLRYNEKANSSNRWKAVKKYANFKYNIALKKLIEKHKSQR